MDCYQVRSQVFTYMDGELSVTEHREVMVHLDECPGCTRVVAFEVRVREVVAQRCCETAPREMRARVLQALGLDDE